MEGLIERQCPEAPLMGKEWEVQDELYSRKHSVGQMLVEQTSSPKLQEGDVEARAVCRTKGQVRS